MKAVTNQQFVITTTIYAILYFVQNVKSREISSSKSPYLPPIARRYHSMPQTTYQKSHSTTAAGASIPTYVTKINSSIAWQQDGQEKTTDQVVPVPFAADRRRKGKRKQAVNAVASHKGNSENLSERTNHGNLKKPIFCYYGSSANKRPSKGKFIPENIDPFLCSHLIFAFVDVTKDGTDLKPNNVDDLGPDGLYARTLALKQTNPKLKILLAVGGWKIGSKPFLPLIKSRSSRKLWVVNVIKYLRRYGFDGFDMDWEFPGWRGSGPEDKHKFTLLMKNLYESFAEEAQETGKPKLILTLATAASVYYIEKSYEAKQIHKYLDYMLLMTYNFHGSGWEKHTGHPSPLLPHPLDPEGEQRELFVLWAVKYWLQMGVPKSKLVVGMATYGLGWKLTDPSKTGVRAPADGGNTKGKYTVEQGILSHYEICEHVIDDGWKVEWIDSQKVPYAYGEGEWVGFESPDSFYLKAVTILKEGLGGAFIWSVEMDDFAGSCGGPRYPLLRTVTEVFTQGSELANLMATSSGHHQQHQQPKHPISSNTDNLKISSSASSNTPAGADSTSHVSDYGDPHSSSSSSTSSSEFHKDYSTNYDYDYGYPNFGEKGLYDKECNKRGIGIHPDPESCHYFLLCAHLTVDRLGSIRMVCPKGTMYDHSLQVCNHEHEVDCNR